MCPNYQVLSAFFDGELPDSQQAKIVEHTEHCTACQERLASFRSIKAYLQKASMASFSESKDKVWERLTVSMKEIKQKQEKRFFFWQKQFLMPLPIIILLASMALFFTLSFLFFTFLLQSAPDGDLFPSQPELLSGRRPPAFAASPAALQKQTAEPENNQSGTHLSKAAIHSGPEGTFIPLFSQADQKIKEFAQIYN